jgi:ankyrin repeat protein
VTEDERCAEAKTHLQLSEAFRRGDLEALRAAVGDPALVPNGQMPLTIGTCLVYAIHHSPLVFIRTLLETGADPNAPVDDGFPPLIAALSCTREVRGTARRTDVEDIVRLLLSFGADVHQRGINDFTPLHMAVAERNLAAIQLLLEHSADPDLRTRIDECETPLEMAEAAGWAEGAALLRRGRRETSRSIHKALDTNHRLSD